MSNISIYDPLEKIGDGEFIEEVSEDFRELNLAVARAQKAGSITITLKVAPNGDRRVLYEATHKVSTPKEKKPSELFFIDEDGHTHRRDPRQGEMNLKRAPQDTSNVTDLKKA